MPDEGEDGPWPGEVEWHPERTPWHDAPWPTVDCDDPEPIGELELPDGQVLVVFPDRPAFGFGRYLEEGDDGRME